MSNKETDKFKREEVRAKTVDGGDLKSTEFKRDALNTNPPSALQPDPNAPAPGSWETEEMKKAREAREKTVAESGGEQRMSSVNPRKPLDKEPVYAPGVGPVAAAENFTHAVPPDRRVPPENVTVAESAHSVAERPEAVSVAAAAQPTPVITPAQAGLPKPELVAGRDPLPEEDPTPSTVPIPPPGPRRVA
jgi:hypothetical protein